jgi:serine/threonine protein kinase
MDLTDQGETEPVVSEFAKHAAKAASMIGWKIGNLELVARLGVGGMGSVFKAEHRTLLTHYAVKILHGQYSSDEVAVERFRQEAIACSKLRHENVVFITDFGFVDEIGLFITMEYLDGIPLGTLIRRKGQLDYGRTVRIVEQVAAAMGAAHRLDIIHRDLKPDNVMILADPTRADFVKVLDFGIAKIRSESNASLTNAGEAVGTPSYMSPESLVDKDNVGGSTDIYSLGCMLYEMLSGNPPFWKGSDFQILSAHVTEKPTPIGDHRPDLTGRLLEKLISDMLEKRPEERPRNMDVVRDRLQTAIYELVEEGVPGAEYIADSHDWIRRSDSWDAVTVSDHTIRLTGVIKRIREVAPASPAAGLLAAMPENMSGSLMSLALWGVVQHELLESEPESKAFALAVDQTLLLTQAVLDSNPGSRRTRNQNRFFRGVEMLLTQLSRDRARILIRELRPLSSNPLFPAVLLPQENSGSWSAIRELLSTEISLRGFRRKDGSLSTEEQAVVPEETDQLEHMPLIDKLKQDLSVKTVKAVLMHDLTGSPKLIDTDEIDIQVEDD